MKMLKRLLKSFGKLFTTTKKVVADNKPTVDVALALKAYIISKIEEKNPDAAIIKLLDGLEEELNDLMTSTSDVDYLISKLTEICTKLNVNPSIVPVLVSLIMIAKSSEVKEAHRLIQTKINEKE